MKHSFNLLDIPRLESVCYNCMKIIQPEDKNGECEVPVVRGKAIENIEVGEAVLVAILPDGTAKVAKANVEGEPDD